MRATFYYFTTRSGEGESLAWFYATKEEAQEAFQKKKKYHGDTMSDDVSPHSIDLDAHGKITQIDP